MHCNFTTASWALWQINYFFVANLLPFNLGWASNFITSWRAYQYSGKCVAMHHIIVTMLNMYSEL